MEKGICIYNENAEKIDFSKKSEFFLHPQHVNIFKAI